MLRKKDYKQSIKVICYLTNSKNWQQQPFNPTSNMGYADFC